MLETPEITQSAPVLTAFIPLTIPRSEIQNVMGPGIMEIYGALGAQGIEPAGPWFTHHSRMDPEVFDFKICVPVKTPVTPTGRVQAGELPGAKVARTVYQGPYEGLGDAWGEFKTWIAANGLAERSDLWEIYDVGPESGPDSSTYRTVLNQPLAD